MEFAEVIKRRRMFRQFTSEDGAGVQYGVPEEQMPVGAIAIGHPDRGNDPIPPLRPGERKPLSELVHRGHW
jgi:nitroreductase